MKGKITIVLFSLVLVFGMLAASCDNNAFPDQDDKDDSTYIVYKADAKNLPTIKDGQPARWPSTDVHDMLNYKEAYTIDGKAYTVYNVWTIVKVPTLPKGLTAYTDDDDVERAKKYTGMQIFVKVAIPAGATSYSLDDLIAELNPAPAAP
jgi:hypothetical protein